MRQDDEKSFYQRLVEGRGEVLPECPWGCGTTVGVYHTPEGLINCPRCPPRAAPTARSEVDLHTGQYRSPEALEAAQERQEIRQCFAEEQHRGILGKGGRSSGGGRSRSKPIKRHRGRFEQDPICFDSDRHGAGIVVTRKIERISKADLRVNLYIPCWFRDELEVEANRQSEMSGTKWPIIRVIRSAMWAQASKVQVVERFGHGTQERISLQVLLYPDEAQLLDVCTAVFECSKGEFVAACYSLYKRLHRDEGR